MSFKDLVTVWERDAVGALAPEEYRIKLPIEDAARIHALTEMYPRRTLDQIVTELLSASLHELERNLPYIPGTRVIAEDEQGDPVFEDIGPTPRFLELSREHRRRLEAK